MCGVPSADSDSHWAVGSAVLPSLDPLVGWSTATAGSLDVLAARRPRWLFLERPALCLARGRGACFGLFCERFFLLERGTGDAVGLLKALR